MRIRNTFVRIRRHIIPVALVLCFTLNFGFTSTESRTGERFFLPDVNIVDVENGRIIPHQDILIGKGLILEVSPGPNAESPIDAVPLNVSGAYVVPALLDLHVHIFDRRDLELYALMGIMTVRNMDGWPWHNSLKHTSEDNNPCHSKLVTTGPQYQASSIDDSSDLRLEFEKDRENGFEWIKLYDDIDEELWDKIAENLPAGARVTGHLPDHVPLPSILDASVLDDIAHAEELLQAMKSESEDWMSLLDQTAMSLKASSTAVVTTLVNNKMILEQASDFDRNISRKEVQWAPPMIQVFWQSEFNPYHSPFDEQALGRMSSFFEELKILVHELHRRGVTMLAGTDAPNPTTIPAFSLYEELRLLNESGFTAADVLASATYLSSDYLFPESGEGRLRPGAAANLIILEADPLEDLSQINNRLGIICKGEYRPASAVHSRLEELKNSYSREVEILQDFDPSSPNGILNAIVSNKEEGQRNALSPEGFESLIWAYWKMGNLDAAFRVAKELRIRYTSESSESIFTFIQEQRNKAHSP